MYTNTITIMKIQILLLTGLSILALIFIGTRVMNNNLDNTDNKTPYRIIFLHHSTGDAINKGGIRRIPYIGRFINQEFYISKWLKKYNQENNTNYIFHEQFFPKSEPYGWNNYPYDYYNIWVKNAGDKPYMEEPTLEILTKEYDMIIFKHCFPVSNIEEDINQPDINSPEKRLENYKLQYAALKKKFNEFPNTRFLVWTGAVQTESNITRAQAERAKTFFDWVKNEWDTPNDNIFLWDFYELETEGKLFLKPEYAYTPDNSHPNKTFAKRAAPLLCERIVEVIQTTN